MEMIREKSKTTEMTSKQEKNAYYFGAQASDGNGTMKTVLGGKGAGLAEMISIGIPVPPGFTISTGACTQYYDSGKKLSDGLWDDVLKNVAKLEKELGKKFGDASNPLL